jgi:hypothetical protein
MTAHQPYDEWVLTLVEQLALRDYVLNLRMGSIASPR